MLDKIILFSIRNKLLVGLFTVALIGWGSYSLFQLPVDAVPDITNNQVQIITVCPTLAGQEVEQLVTYPIEQSMANLPRLEELRSISRFGLSVITVVFHDDVDIYFARQLITERLKEAESQIPPGLGTPELTPVSTGLGEIYQYIIHPKKGSESKYSAMDLRTMQDWIVARQLYGTPGVAEVNSFGGELKQYEVAVNPDRLFAMGVTVSDIFTALQQNNENTGGAYIDKKPNAYFIRGVGLVRSFDDIRNIVIRSNPNGIPVLIKDVAEVRFGSAVRYGALSYNGEKDVVGGVIMMLKGANSAEVVKLIKEKLPVIQQSLPEDVTIEAFLDRTDLVNHAITTVEKNLVEGALIVIFVLVVFLGNLRAGLIVASAIPLSMLFALGMMHVFGVSANLMSLGAIDFGLIVDGAVIIVEAVMHHLGLRKTTHALTQGEMDEEVFRSASKIRKSAAFGEVIILIVYLPVLTLIGIEGKMFRPMAQTVGFAIMGALILSLTYIPAMCALLLPRKPDPRITLADRLIGFLQRIYAPLLTGAIRFKKLIIGSALALFAGAVLVFLSMGGEFIPTLQEGDFAFHCILPQGTSLSQSIETSMQASRIIKTVEEVNMVVGKTGSAEVPTDPMPPEATDLIIVLKPRNEWKRNISYDELGDEILQKLEVIPGVFFEKNQPIQMRFNELMTGVRQDVAVKIFGENLDTLSAYAAKVAAVISRTPGATEALTERTEGLPQVTIRYNRAQLANYGLNIGNINHLVSTAFAGGKAGVVFENERKFDLVVRLDSAYRRHPLDVGNLFIPVQNGNQVPITQVADIRLEEGPAQISREGGRRRMVIGFNIKDRDVSSVVRDIQDALSKQVSLPEGYYFTYGGTFQNLQAASKRLMVAVPVALLLIFVLLYFTFNSARQAILIYTAIPMSAIGGVFALTLRGMPFSISAGIGFIALFGVAVLNGIVLLSTFNQLEKEGVTDVLQRVREGTQARLRPVLMTALVASLGFLPMALSHGAGAEVQKPLATVVIGGLISATLLTLFVLPLLYLLFSSRPILPKPAVPALVACCLFAASPGRAQTMLSMPQAVDFAQQNNLSGAAKQQELQASQKLKGSVFELPKTSLTMQYGQYNSIKQDLGFQVSQSIPFPTVFGARSRLYQAEVSASELRLQATASEIKAQVQALYCQLVYLEETRQQLVVLDSLFEGFVKGAAVRYHAGETGVLEKISAENKQGQLKLLLKQNLAESAQAYATLKAWMNYPGEFSVAASGPYEPMGLPQHTDTSQVSNNPLLQSVYQEATLAAKIRKTEWSLAMPDLTLGYFNQSLIGTQTVNGNNVYYDRSKRFQGLNFGISVPITFFSNAARLKSLELKEGALQKEAAQRKRLMQTELNNALLQYAQDFSQYTYYKTQALPGAEVMIRSAAAGYKSGQTGYIEYLQVLQTVADIRLSYLTSINQVNQSVIRIQYLTHQ